MNENKIKFLKEIPYRSDSQDAVESPQKYKVYFNYKKIRKGNEKYIDLNTIVIDINVVYYNTILSVIKATPNKVIFSLKKNY